MKRSFPFIVMALAVTTLVTFASCKKNSTPPSLADQITGKWYMQAAIGNYTNYGDNHKDTTTFTGVDYFDFKADSTVSIWAENTAYAGKWSIVNNRLFITGSNYLDNSDGWDVSKLTKTDLQLYYKKVIPDIETELWLNLTR